MMYVIVYTEFEHHDVCYRLYKEAILEGTQLPCLCHLIKQIYIKTNRQIIAEALKNDS